MPSETAEAVMLVAMVRDRARAFLAGPPLLKAATGEIATEEELGGALMHASVSGLAEYLAEDDADAIRALREHLRRLAWHRHESPLPAAVEPRFAADELLGVMPVDGRKPVDMREVIARLCDDSDFMEFQPAYGPATVCVHASIGGFPVGILSNNGPLDPAGSSKATHFIQQCCQSGLPLVYLQNTTGYIVGTASERAGMIKHGSKMIQEAKKQKRFLLSAYPPHCSFCLTAGPESLVEVLADPPIEFTFEPVVISGRLAVLENDVVYYRLTNAAAAKP